MATFSSSPVPRRRYVAPGTNSNTSSPPTNVSRRKGISSRTGSRFVTPRADGSRGTSFASGMDVDNNASNTYLDRLAKTDAIFAKSEELSVTSYAQLPGEVKQVLKNADFYRDAYTGDIDILTGFALVASSQACFVWQHAQALTVIPTCYIFSCPSNNGQNTTPFHALVPSTPSREPGLLLVSSSGNIRYWDSVASGLAGGEHFVTASLSLSSNEEVTTLSRSEFQTYIVSTSLGRIFRVALTATGGKHHITARVFSLPQTSTTISRFLPSLWGGAAESTPAEPENIASIAIGEQTEAGKDVWSLLETRIQRWSMTDDGWEELMHDEDVTEPISAAIRGAFASAPQDDGALDLELLDLHIAELGKLLVLVSFAGVEDESFMDVGTHPRRIYALVRLANAMDAFTIESIGTVPYQSTSSSGAPMHPRLKWMSSGTLIGIQFGDAVAFCASDSAYQDRIELKSSADRTLGVGVSETEGEMLVLSATTMLKVTLDMDKVATFDPENGKARLIKSIMTQAILYGSNPQNPLNFSFPPELDEESLMSGADQLSRAVLQSDAEVVRPNHDITAQMTGRKERLSFLISFINENGVLPKMSQWSRQRLATDAEKLYAGHQLWLKYSHFISSGAETSVLNEAIYSLMLKAGESHHDDFVRAFFRLRIAELGQILPYVVDIIRRLSSEASDQLVGALPEANEIALTVLNAANDYREYNAGVYGVQLPMIKPWTSKPAVIDMVLDLFETTTRILESPTDLDTADRSAKSEPMRQLPELASLLFATIYERLEWLRSPMAAEDSTSVREKVQLEERFQQLRPEILEALRRNAHAEHAFAVAEKYRDFRSLASLCNKENVYPPQENPNAARIQTYIERFKDEFTTELYRWYIEHGELRTMFAQEDVQGTYLDNFFADHPDPNISWIHDVRKRRFTHAASSLFTEAVEASELSEKQLMLSIGKLAHLAQAQEPGLEGAVDMRTLDGFHDQLDFVSVHEAIIKDFKETLAKARVKSSLDAQVDTVIRAKASQLMEKKVFLSIFRQLVRRLLQGHALSIEDMVDVLTLKDNAGDDDTENYVTALHLLWRDRTVPDARAAVALRSTWRRIYTRDDWDSIRQTVGVTDAALNQRYRRTALYAVLHAGAHDDGHNKFPVLMPDQAMQTSATSEIASRWPGMTPEQVEAIDDEYAKESEHLERLRLEDVIERIRELATQEQNWS